MTPTDLQLIRRAFTYYNRMLDPGAMTRDREELQTIWVDEPEIVPLRAALEGGVAYRGEDALERFRAEALETWSELEIEVSEISGKGPRYLVEGTLRGRGRSSGAEITSPMWFVMTVRDGRIARAASHLDRDGAVAELG